MIDFRTEPASYRHWKMTLAGPVAILAMDVDENRGLAEGYELKLNSYDLGVDLELYDATQRLRFEHPEVRSVILTSAKERIFCAGANIKMLGLSSHPFKVNFCKFTNETRNSIEDATRNSGQFYLAAIGGPCAGGGYELALATDYIMMADDGSTSVSLPEVPLLAVLPGTGGLTRLVDKRGVRRDLADFFCTTEEGVKGKRAVEWRLVDEVVPRTRLTETANQRALEFAAHSNRPAHARGITLAPLRRTIDERTITYDHLTIELDRDRACVTLLIQGPSQPVKSPIALGCDFWPLAVARELDDAILHLRFNEEALRTWVFRTQGDAALVASYDAFLSANPEDWLVREIILYLKRTLKRVDVSARSLFALVEPGSCFVGSLLELALASDRAYMLRGPREGDETPPARILLTDLNFGPLPMCNGLSRLESRFLHEPDKYRDLRARVGEQIEAETAQALGLIGFAPDDLDWDDEVRLAIEERAAFSGDALTGMEASLRFGGPETIESKIFARLSAWQNWIFQRPNAVGEKGALKLYGTGRRPEFDLRRV
jgi:benzoyl-CoA-dihydrodiol lyase